MPGDSRKRVTTGDPFRGIPAELYNLLCDMAADYKRRGKTGPGGVDLGSSEGLKLVQNNSVADCPRFGVMTLQQVIITPATNLIEFQDRAAFTGGNPVAPQTNQTYVSTPPPFGQFCIAYEPIPQGQIGRAWVFGVCPVQVNFTNATDLWADTLDGDNTQLQSSPYFGGAMVLWKAAGTGKQWALVRIGNCPRFDVTGKITGAYSYNGPGLSTKGAARYKMALGVGSVKNLDPTSNFKPPDANMTFPTDPNAVWVNLFEGGSAASGTAVVASGAIVKGFYAGQDNENPSLPVFYGSSAPTGTLFLVNLAMDGGSLGNASYPSSWTYTVTTYTGSVTLGTMMTPLRPRPIGALDQATLGTAFIDYTGAIQLAEAWEVPEIYSCTVTY